MTDEDIGTVIDEPCTTSSRQINWDASSAVRPVLVHQLLDAQQAYSDAPFTIGGNEVNQVTTVAAVVRVDKKPLSVDFCLEDGSKLGGRVIAHQWYNLDDIQGPFNDEEVIGVRAHEYVRVVGTLSRFNGRNSLDIVQIRKVTKAHEIDFHMLEAFTVNLLYQRGQPPGENPDETVRGSPIQTQMSSLPGDRSVQPSMPFTSLHEQTCSARSKLTLSPDVPVEKEVKSAIGPSQNNDEGSVVSEFETSSELSRLSLSRDSPSSSGENSLITLQQASNVSPVTTFQTATKRKRNPYSGLTSLQRSIIFHIQQAVPSAYEIDGPGREWEGVHIDVVITQLITEFGDSLRTLAGCDVNNAILFLIGEGYIYSTIDEFHFNVT